MDLSPINQAQPNAERHELWTRITPLNGTFASLVPLTMEHREELEEAVKDGELWKLWYARVPSPEGMKAEIERRLGLYEQGVMHPYTVLDKDGKMVGMTSYQTLDEANRRVKIGFTWYAKSVQGTPLNTQAKLLLLTHAFEKLEAIAACFTTHSYNHASRRAIEALGARLDGILRNDAILADGTYRDTCYYSILENEWPTVKKHLRWKLASRLETGQAIRSNEQPKNHAEIHPEEKEQNRAKG